jgi:hypothetical protein
LKAEGDAALRFPKEHQAMVWLSAVSLIAGGLLAQRFKIIVVAPATFVIAVVAIGVGITQKNDFWSIIFIMATATVGMQLGYFVGVLIQYGPSESLAQGKRSRHRTVPLRNPLSDRRILK